ncbi:MAG: ribbon-helix-helix protein, CopG family [Betaproteobacteria bacterium]|nr:ribbon-helix-helix protein, CopG family [Betaproteobacteria bacterium]
MAEQLLIRMDPELKRKLARLATREGKTATQVVRDLIEEYVKNRDVASYIDALWGRIGQRLKSAGLTAGDVAKAVREVRKSKTRDAGRR